MGTIVKKKKKKILDWFIKDECVSVKKKKKSFLKMAVSLKNDFEVMLRVGWVTKLCSPQPPSVNSSSSLRCKFSSTGVVIGID